ncbi:hypothetical protein [Rosistilla oblonga]|uniref:Uncharacterized protein n=1 Tax=Rosistilla oblonga TaxID=2527990 RepID=A0A518IRM9_9BACT|nr:hypothetical protein [Rosistilla oblonga]QDV55756.1 hypothetical protein Mal33_17350 [Rosistilla oblonga]
MNASCEQSSATRGSSAVARWSIAALLSAAVAWTLVNFTPIQFRLPPELRSVDMYSPPELQAQQKELVPITLWRTCIAELTFAGLSLGGVSTLLIAGAGTRSRLRFVAVGIFTGLAFGFLAGQIGWTLRAALATGSLSTLSSDPIVRETLLYFVVSLTLGCPLAIAYYLASGKQAGQGAIAVLLACGLAGAIVPIAAAPFPNMLTHHFPPEGLGLSGIWFGLIGCLASLLPNAIGSKAKDVSLATVAESTSQPAGEV